MSIFPYSYYILNLHVWRAGNLSTKDKMAGPNVSFIQRFHCMGKWKWSMFFIERLFLMCVFCSLLRGFNGSTYNNHAVPFLLHRNFNHLTKLTFLQWESFWGNYLKSIKLVTWLYTKSISNFRKKWTPSMLRN